MAIKQRDRDPLKIYSGGIDEMERIIEIKNLNKSFGDVKAVQDMLKRLTTQSRYDCLRNSLKFEKTVKIPKGQNTLKITVVFSVAEPELFTRSRGIILTDVKTILSMGGYVPSTVNASSKL